jgi:hypothetical protein
MVAHLRVSAIWFPLLPHTAMTSGHDTAHYPVVRGSIRHPASGIRHPASGIRGPARLRGLLNCTRQDWRARLKLGGTERLPHDR